MGFLVMRHDLVLSYRLRATECRLLQAFIVDGARTDCDRGKIFWRHRRAHFLAIAWNVRCCCKVVRMSAPVDTKRPLGVQRSGILPSPSLSALLQPSGTWIRARNTLSSIGRGFSKNRAGRRVGCPPYLCSFDKPTQSATPVLRVSCSRVQCTSRCRS